MSAGKLDPLNRVIHGCQCMPWATLSCGKAFPAGFLPIVLMAADCLIGCADFYMSLYNVIFSVLPPLVIGIFDQDVNREMSRLYPGAVP